MFVNKNIDINIVSYPISMAISIVPNIVDIDIDISLTPGAWPLVKIRSQTKMQEVKKFVLWSIK